MRDIYVYRKITVVFIIMIFFLFMSCSGCGRTAEQEGMEEISLSQFDAKSAGEEKKIAEKGTAEEKKTEGSGRDTGKEQNSVFVYVCGAVNAPGVYELDKGARIFEAVEAAGGMTSAAADFAVNQARKVNDGEQIYVPTVEETAGNGTEFGESEIAGSMQTDKVNINTAGKEELMTLTGIGEAKAESIIRFRQEQGGFSKIEDLMKIEGIKEGVFNKIKDDITI